MNLTPEMLFVIFAIVFGVACNGAIKLFYNPDKINLASLGNLTPHVHWHVIPRFYDDDHFPDSIWSQQKKFKKTEISDQIRKKINAFILKNLN